MATRHIEVQEADFDFAAHYEAARKIGGTDAGAIAGFVGLVRDHNKIAGDGSEVRSLTLEHYPGMTESSIEAIVDEAEFRWPLLATRVIHRVGTLLPEDQIVLVLVVSGHRDAAFAAAEFIMDSLKTRAIFWKREVSANGNQWIESTGKDLERSEKWRTQPS